MNSDALQGGGACSKESQHNSESSTVSPVHDRERLEHTSLMTALAIGLHNFPEGLATFIGMYVCMYVCMHICIECVCMYGVRMSHK
jgi:zinc transporter ZupT